nr:putative swi/snf-related matrix-associated actin-dependent regulator [Quercus suber]
MFRVYEYNGKVRTNDFEVLQYNDIVLMTYGTLADDDHKKQKCSAVDRIVQQSKLVTPATPETSDADDAEPSSSKGNSSLKVSSLLQLLEKSRDDYPATKSIIFSQFRPDAPIVLLASHQALDMGKNLTAASRVYFLEPWWNAALEN